MKSQQGIRVLLVSRILAHYRLAVYNALANDPRSTWYFAGGRDTPDNSIPLIDPEQLSGHFAALRNVWAGKCVWQFGLFKHLLRLRPRVVIFEGNFANLSTWVAALVCRLAGCRVLFWTIGWHRPERGLRRLARLGFYHLAHHLLIYGRSGAQIGMEMGFPGHRMTVINNSYSSSLALTDVDPPILRALESRLPPRREPVVGAVIRLNPAKRLDLLVRAAARYVETYEEAIQVLLVGEGPARTQLEGIAQELGVSLFLPGAVYSAAELDLVYEYLNLTVVPEWAGLTVIQSMSRGVPVVTHGNFLEQAPEAEAIVPGRTGSLFRQGSVDDLSQHMRTWVSQTPRERAAAAEACRSEVQRAWTPSAHATAILDAIYR